MNTPNWFLALLERKDITDICLNGSSQEVYIDQGNGLEKICCESTWSAEAIKSWVLDQLSGVGKSWDARHPFVDATLLSRHRMHVSFPPVSQKGILISLRRLPSSHVNRSQRWGQDPFFTRLTQIIHQGDSLIIAGATGSGKTTLANDLLAEAPPHQRILALEDTPELAPAHPHFLSLTSRTANADGFGEITLRMLMKQCLRMRPDRIILGECRGDEVLELLQALNTGHRGALATLHANSPRDALRRIELLCLLASQGTVPIPAIRELLALGIQWIVQVQRRGAIREITELWRIEGREGDTILMRPMVKGNS